MQTDLSTPVRRLRISFDMEVRTNHLSDVDMGRTPETAPFLPALLNDPALSDRLAALQAIHCVLKHMDKMTSDREEPGWLPYAYYDVMRPAVGSLTIDQALPLLAFEMLAAGDPLFIRPLTRLHRAELTHSLPLITDLDSGEPLDWQAEPPTPILFKSQNDEYWLVKIQGENVLVLNLLHFPSTWEVVLELDATAAELQQAGLEVQRILALVGNNEVHLIPEASDAIQVCCAESFPGLPVEIKIIDLDEEDADEPIATAA